MTAFEKYLYVKNINKSILCVGLDPVLEKLPVILKKEVNSIYIFCRDIIEATKNMVCGYKLNFAFFEQFGVEGYEILKRLFDLIPNDLIKIADAKRADIGNTSKAYAKSIFDYFMADAITVNPYMGFDSLSPFFDYSDKIVFILALTSNPGSQNFQKKIINEKPLYQLVIEDSINWGNSKNTGFVVGATHPKELVLIRKIVPDNILLIPGIGAQGGDIEAIIKANNNGPAIINVSRSVIFSSSEKDYAESAAQEVKKLNKIINNFSK
ncbi:MAG: orotidine-5'-phosphate decarboxylase [Candidatus Kapabacteria bacterium]|nr:orotidine-5'-phosphate decarboxylase [Candidatus Kapabacteria bacterium]